MHSLLSKTSTTVKTAAPAPTLALPVGTKLYRGIGEDVIHNHAPAADGCLWTTESLTIARSYIPASGLSVITTLKHLIEAPCERTGTCDLQQQLGFEYTDVKYEENGRPNSYRPPKLMDTLVPEPYPDKTQFTDQNQYFDATYAWQKKRRKALENHVKQKLSELGYEPENPNDYDGGHYRLKIDSVNGKDVLLPNKMQDGTVCVFEVVQSLNIYDMTDGGRVEGDLMDPQYREYSKFETIAANSYDGVKIADYAQIEGHGNFGHTAIGIFKAGMPKIKEVERLTATHPEDLYADLKKYGAKQQFFPWANPFDPLREYAQKVREESPFIRGIYLIGDTTSRFRILYDFGHINLGKNEDRLDALDVLEDIIEDTIIDLDTYDAYFKANGRYFFIANGAGRGLMECTEFAKQHPSNLRPTGRPLKKLAAESNPKWERLKRDFLSGIVYHGTTLEIANLIMKEGFRGLEFDEMLSELMAKYGVTEADLRQKFLEPEDTTAVWDKMMSLKRSYEYEHHFVSTCSGGEVATRWAGGGGEVPRQIEAYLQGVYGSNEIKNSKITGEPVVIMARIKDFQNTDNYQRAARWITGTESLMGEGFTSGRPYTVDEAVNHLWTSYSNFLCKADQLEPLRIIQGAALELLKIGPLPEGKLAAASKKHEEATTQINLPKELAWKIREITKKIIPKDDLAADGYDTAPHITIKFGVEENEDKLIEAIKDEPPFEITLGTIHVFDPSAHSDGACPVVLKVDAPELKNLHNAVGKAIGNQEDEFPYTAHTTLAYVRPEIASKYEGMSVFEGITFIAPDITLSKRDNIQITIPFKQSKTATSRKDRAHSLIFTADVERFPPVVIIQYPQGMRWRSVLKVLKQIAGEIVGKRVPWQTIHIWESPWGTKLEQDEGWEKFRARGQHLMYDIMEDSTFLSVGKGSVIPEQPKIAGAREKIKGTLGGSSIEWECLCGNRVMHAAGFTRCDRDGHPSPMGTARFVRCNKCGRLINRKTLEVFGMAPRSLWGEHIKTTAGTEEETVTAATSMGQYPSHSVQIALPPGTADQIVAAGVELIPDTELAGIGREDEPHISVKIGIADNPKKLSQALAAVPPFTVTLGKIKVFTPSPLSNGACPIVVGAESPELQKLHQIVDEAIGRAPDTWRYNPHLTLAFVNPEDAKKYDGSEALQGISIPVQQVTISRSDKSKINIPLGQPMAKGMTAAVHPREKIKTDKYNNWECICGTTSDDYGFYPCNRQGDYTDAGSDESSFFRCDNCGRIIQRKTLEVYGQVINTRDPYDGRLRLVSAEKVKGTPRQSFTWICVCGNQDKEQTDYLVLKGFSPYNRNSGQEPEEFSDWDHIHYRCNHCGRIINRKTLQVMDRAPMGLFGDPVKLRPTKTAEKIRGTPKERMIGLGFNDWICVCGNEWFTRCNRHGQEIDSYSRNVALRKWDNIHGRCLKCGRIINGKTLQVTGIAPTGLFGESVKMPHKIAEKVEGNPGHEAYWKCPCGELGIWFARCDRNGEDIEDNQIWNKITLRCTHCGRIINRRTMQVIGIAPRGLFGNTKMSAAKTAEKIKQVPNPHRESMGYKDFKCLCGTFGRLGDGFQPCDRNGVSPAGAYIIMGLPKEEWDGRHIRCEVCGRIINQKTLEVTGRAPKDLFGDTHKTAAKIPRKLWHGTKKSNLPNILKHGLTPKKARPDAGVYLAGDPFTAENYSGMYGDEPWVVLEIDVSKLDVSKFGVDDYELPDAWENGMIPARVMNQYNDSSQVQYHGVIPPAAIAPRDLFGGVTKTAEKIKGSPKGYDELGDYDYTEQFPFNDWKCVCGNTIEVQGFYPCDRGGQAWNHGWDKRRVRCGLCGRIINNKTMEVVSMAPKDLFGEVTKQSSAKTAEKIEGTPQDGTKPFPIDWVCVCGGDAFQFNTCNKDGKSPYGRWDRKHYSCHTCGRIVDKRTLQVVGIAPRDLFGERTKMGSSKTAEKIKVTQPNDGSYSAGWECLCGNTKREDGSWGFSWCDAQGKQLKGINTSSKYSLCRKCGRIINNKTYKVIGMASRDLFGKQTLLGSHKTPPLSDTEYDNPEQGEGTNAYTNIPEKVKGTEMVPTLEELAPQMFEKAGSFRQLYHGTSGSSVESIQKSGVLGSESDEGKVWLTEDKDSAIQYGKDASHGMDTEVCALLVVDGSKVPGIEQDLEHDGIWTVSKIPVNAITRIETYDLASGRKLTASKSAAGTIRLFHVTTPDVAKRIKAEGFKPVPQIEWKHYYAPQGKDGVYFYDNLRNSADYAAYFKGKLYTDGKLDKDSELALITVEIPEGVAITTKEREDGYFVPSGQLGKVKVLDISEYRYEFNNGYQKGEKLASNSPERMVTAAYAEGQNSSQHTRHNNVQMYKTLKSDPFAEEWELFRKDDAPAPAPKVQDPPSFRPSPKGELRSILFSKEGAVRKLPKGYRVSLEKDRSGVYYGVIWKDGGRVGRCGIADVRQEIARAAAIEFAWQMSGQERPAVVKQ